MSSYSGDYSSPYSGYSGYSGDVGTASNAPAAANPTGAAADIRAGRPVTTSTGQVVPQQPRGAAGRSDLALNLLEFCLFVALIGVSAASIKQIKDITDNGSATDKAALCYIEANQVYRLVIGILVVSSVGAVHTLFALILASIKKLPASRYCLTFCILPHAIVLITLGIIIIAWGSPSATTAVGLSAWDFCRGIDPYQLAFSSGAVAVGFGGFILLFGPGCALVAIIEDIRNNPRLVQAQQVITAESGKLSQWRAIPHHAANAAAQTAPVSEYYSDYSDIDSYDA